MSKKAKSRRVRVMAPSIDRVSQLIDQVLFQTQDNEVTVRKNQSVFSVSYEYPELVTALAPDEIVRCYGETGYTELLLFVQDEDGVRAAKIWLANDSPAALDNTFADVIATAVYNDYRGEECSQVAWLIPTCDINPQPVRVTADGRII